MIPTALFRWRKALGLVLLAACALGAVGAQGASAAQSHEFHGEDAWMVVTGEGKGAHTFSIGAVGTVSCTKTAFESAQTGSKVGILTYATDAITVTPRYEECTFGGQPAVVRFNHCAYVFDSDTTYGNATKAAAEHANVTIECSEGDDIEIHTATCTVTIAPQVVEHAARYQNMAANEVTVEMTAEKIEVGRVRSTAAQPANGCLLFPTGAVATATGGSATKCFHDGGTALSGTDKTTPGGFTFEVGPTGCAIT